MGWAEGANESDGMRLLRHEAGHAIQHVRDYPFLTMRSNMRSVRIHRRNNTMRAPYPAA